MLGDITKKYAEIKKRQGPDTKLTKMNLKFIELIVKDVKSFDAYKLAGYIGNRESAYQLKHKLKPFIDKYYEVEGVSREGYKAKMLKLLELPCVDRQGKPIDSLTFNQYKEVLEMLRHELEQAEAKNRTPQHITAFVIRTYADANRDKGTGGSKVIDIDPVDVSSSPPAVGGG